MKPVIGITPSLAEDGRSYRVHQAHCQAIKEAGGLPIILPFNEDKTTSILADYIDGLYLTGGDDIDPHYFNEEPHMKLGPVDPERDEFEIMLFHEVLGRKKPILGVCRGSQIINIALGGTMYQDLPTQKTDPLLQHVQDRSLRYGSHFVELRRESLLYKITKQKRIKVNSYHHQANHKLGKGLRIAALSNDGVIEAIEGIEDNFILGVQWHPERMLVTNDLASQAMYSQFVASAYTEKREISKRS